MTEEISVCQFAQTECDFQFIRLCSLQNKASCPKAMWSEHFVNCEVRIQALKIAWTCPFCNHVNMKMVSQCENKDCGRVRL